MRCLIRAVAVNLGDSNAETGGYAAGDVLSGIENLIGSAHNDSLTGDGGANVLEGGAGADTLTGGAGADTLTGGGGADRFIVNFGAGESLAKATDRITDFEQGSDKIRLIGVGGFDALTLTNNQFTWLGGVATGKGVQTLIVMTGASVEITATDFVFDDGITWSGTSDGDTRDGDYAADMLSGEGGDDVLSGEGGNDTLDGGTGNDTLDGGTGADSLTGGGGKDEFAFDAFGNDTITDFTDGEDLIKLVPGVVFDGDVIVRPAGTGTGTEITWNGGTLILTGTPHTLIDENDFAFDDSITGTDGDDGRARLFGGDGDDIIRGMAGDDVSGRWRRRRHSDRRWRQGRVRIRRVWK